MSEPHRHHYIPEFYLKGWIDSEGLVTKYSRPYRDVVIDRRAPRAIGYEYDLYAYRDVPLDQKQRMEKEFFRKIDDGAATILKSLLSGEAREMSVEDRSAFTRFILSLRGRHPDAVRKAVTQGDEALITELNRDPEDYEAIRGENDPTTLLEFAKLAMPARVGNVGMSALADSILDEEAGKSIFHMDWWVQRIDQSGLTLLTSDRPCLLTGDARKGPCLIALPLSPTMILFISNVPAAKDRLMNMGSRQIVKLTNGIVVDQAVKQVYGRDAQHLPLVEKRLRRLPR